jgi:hypothetical protein
MEVERYRSYRSSGVAGVQEYREFRIRTIVAHHSATPELLQLLTPAIATPEVAPPSICVMLQS